ncbi:MAG: hypothetical protein FWG00_02245 [Coriobacteriia bacterium]|nr:hypothetical protein [Coriobacteriia bacterium]
MNEKPYVTKMSLTKRMIATFLAVMLACATMVVAPASAFGDEGELVSAGFTYVVGDENAEHGAGIYIKDYDGGASTLTVGNISADFSWADVVSIELSDLNPKLTSLDVQACVNLAYLDCSNNALATLRVKETVQGNTNRNNTLVYLDCSNNNLSYLGNLQQGKGVQYYEKLEWLVCSNNKLDNNSTSELMLPASLIHLDCSGTGYKALNISLCTELESLICFGMTNLGAFTVNPNPLIHLTTVDYGNTPGIPSNITEGFDAMAITSFEIDGVFGDIDEEAGEITLTFPYGTDVTALTPVIDWSGASIYPEADDSAVDFTDDVVYTVTAQTGGTKEYTVSVVVVDPSDECDIVSFAVEGIDDDMIVMDGTDIAVTVPFDADIADLVPTIECSEFATVSPESGIAMALDNLVAIYTVTAQDGTTQDYTVTVTVAPDPNAEIIDPDDGTGDNNNNGNGGNNGNNNGGLAAPVAKAPAISGVSKVTVNAGYKKFSKTFKVTGSPAPEVSIKVPKKAKGKISINKNGKLTVKKGLKKGTYTVHITAKNAAGVYSDKKVKIVVNAKGSALIAGPDQKVLKVGYKKTTIKCKVTGAKAKVSIKVPTAAKGKISINKKGKTTIKKGLKAGTYKVTLKAKNKKGKMDRVLTIIVK